jgi:hypothetical protein
MDTMDQEHVDMLCAQVEEIEALLEKDLEQKWEILALLGGLEPASDAIFN